MSSAPPAGTGTMMRTGRAGYVSALAPRDSAGNVAAAAGAAANIAASATDPAMTPSFFGTNPGEVRTGPRTGTRILGAEEDLGDGILVLTTQPEPHEARYRRRVLPVERSERILITVLGPSDQGTFVLPPVGLSPVPIGRDRRDVRGRWLERGYLHPA